MDQIIATLSKIAPEKAADIAALKEMREAAVLNKKALEAVVSYKNGTITYEAAQKELGVLKQKYKPAMPTSRKGKFDTTSRKLAMPNSARRSAKS